MMLTAEHLSGRSNLRPVGPENRTVASAVIRFLQQIEREESHWLNATKPKGDDDKPRR